MRPSARMTRAPPHAAPGRPTAGLQTNAHQQQQARAADTGAGAVPAAGGGVPATFQPNNGDATAVHAWSLTIGALSSRDVPTAWLTRLQDYMRHYDLKGAAALERGGKKSVLHIQVVLETTAATDAAGTTAFRNHFPSFVPISTTDSAKLTFKPLGEGQTFKHMLGYVQKDAGTAHYRLVHHNVTAVELTEARHAYAEVAGDYRTNNILITKKGFVERIASFWMCNYSPFLVPQDVCLLSMIWSGRYAPAAPWCTPAPGQFVDPVVSTSWFLMVERPTSTTLEHVRNLFWGWHQRHLNTHTWRYFSQAIDFNSVLDSLQSAACNIWYDHANEVEVMFAVVFEMRKLLVQANISFDNYKAIDGMFVTYFQQVYNSVSAGLHGGPSTRCAQVPAYLRPITETDAFRNRHDVFNPASPPSGGAHMPVATPQSVTLGTEDSAITDDDEDEWVEVTA
eukprot:gene14989-biopygen322